MATKKAETVVGPRPPHELMKELQANLAARRQECQEKINFLLDEYGFTFAVQIEAQYDGASGVTRHVVKEIGLVEKPPTV